MSDEQTRPTDPDAPVPSPSAYGGTATYEQPPPVYAAPPQARPRFADQVLGMRAVVAVALASLVVGGSTGFVLGHATAGDDGRFGGPGGFPNFQERGTLPNAPNGIPNAPNGNPNQP